MTYQPRLLKRPIGRLPIAAHRYKTQRAVANELRRVNRLLAVARDYKQRPVLLGARAALEWVLTNEAPRPSQLYESASRSQANDP